MRTAEQRCFIELCRPAAQSAAVKFDVPASVTIAQAIQESGWGRSALCKIGNNFFGIKITDCSQPFLTLHTSEVLTPGQFEDLCRHRPWVEKRDEGAPRADGKREYLITDRFRHFASPEACFEFRAEMLATEKRYEPAMLAAGDAMKFATELQQCGYSTDPDYAREICGLIEEFDLEQYDAVAQTQRANSSKEEGQQ